MNLTEFIMAALEAFDNPEERQRYVNQMRVMHERAQAWRKDHPNEEVLINWGFPRIASISRAVQQQYIAANPAGLSLIKSLWSWDADDEPTVFMVRAVIEDVLDLLADFERHAGSNQP